MIQANVPHDILKKCLFPIDAYVFSCPTQTKNIERYLPEVFDAINVEIDGGIEAHQRMCNMGC